MIKTSLLRITLEMIREFICKKNKRMACGTHLFGDFIKNRSEAAFAPDFQAELFPCCFLLIETGNKLLKSHEQQTLWVWASLKAMASINLKPNDVRNAIT